MAKPGKVVIERDTRLSQSMLWASQREYYHEQGVSAWSGAVPFYITSNPYIANVYATIVVRFIQDVLKQKPKAINELFYIMEIGAGSGQFSFYVQRRLKHLLNVLGLEKVKYCYVMTDFTKNNIHYWEEHSALKPFLSENILDFAVYDAEKGIPIKLIRNKIELNSQCLKNPLIVFANYLFDSVINDVFVAKNEVVYESLMTMSTSSDNLKNKKPVKWDKVKFAFTERPLGKTYYREPKFDEVLASYAKDLKKSSFLFPVGALRCVQHLHQISNGQLMLVSSDKGFSVPSDMDNTNRPQFDFHGSFSLMVNYDAIAKYVKALGGDACLQSERDDIVTGVFVTGTDFAHSKETQLALEQYVDGLSPADYFNLYDNTIAQVKKNKLQALASFLILSDWDPFVYEDFADFINDEIHKADENLVEFFSKNFPKIAEKFYYLPKAHDIFFDMAIFYQNVNRYDEALNYYEISQSHFGESHGLFYNRGLCHYYDHRREMALENFQKAKKLKPRDVDVNEWIIKLNKELQRL